MLDALERGGPYRSSYQEVLVAEKQWPRLIQFIEERPETIKLYCPDVNAPINKKRFTKNVGFNQNYHGDKSLLSPPPKIEKIMVDLFVDPSLYIIDVAQRDLIFRNILGEYAVNFKTLLSYARSRNKKEAIKEYIEHSLGFDMDTGEFYDQREKL